MQGPAKTQLVPIQELTPGAVGAIRNQVINDLIKKASADLNIVPDKFVVRDVRPFGDLQLLSAGTTAMTIEEWLYTATTGTGYVSWSGTRTMGDNRYVALFGIRDLRFGMGPHATASGTTTGQVWAPLIWSFLRINVGGADKVHWDCTSMQPYVDQHVSFAPTAVIIPQNTSYNISIYKTETLTDIVMRLQLIGVAVEPRGLLISP